MFPCLPAGQQVCGFKILCRVHAKYTPDCKKTEVQQLKFPTIYTDVASISAVLSVNISNNYRPETFI